MRLSRILPAAAAIAALALAACSKVDDAEDGGIPSGNLVSLFEPTAGTVPFPFDGLFSGFSDPTLNIPQTAAPAVAANLTDGFSTTANIFTDFLGFLDFSTTAEGLMVFEMSTPPRKLEEGVDYMVSDYPATSVIPGTSIEAPTNSFRTRLLISPLKPLQPSTRYVVVVTDALKDMQGNSATPSQHFRIVRNPTPVDEQDDPAVQLLPPTTIATLGALQASLITPVLDGITAITGLPRDSVVIAWPFTTQSIGKTLASIADNAETRAQTLDIAASSVPAPFGGPIMLGSVLGLPAPLAEIMIGAIELPYFHAIPDSDPTVILSSYWQADPTKPDMAATFLGQVPCPAFAMGAPLPGGLTAQPSESTTTCFPVPVEQDTVRVPLLLTVPDATAPAEGWPVVIFQHGITSDRSALLGLAPALSMAGFAAIAIDLPLHGIVEVPDCAGDALCDSKQLLRLANALTNSGERTFDVDLTNNVTGAPGPDGQQDSSGAHFVNIASLPTSRDNLRQAVSDLLHLRASLTTLATQVDIDPSRVYFVGHSLGGIVGTPFVALDDNITAATLAMPGGGIGKLLDASMSFGPRIGAGLAQAGAPEGSDAFETVLRFAQHLVDDGDPINYAHLLQGRKVHFVEIAGDLVVPNAAPRNPATGGDPTLHLVTVEGPLSGSTPLIEALGLDVVEIENIASHAATTLLGADAVKAVRLHEGDHSSLLLPTGSPAAFSEIQAQTANFLASDGNCLPIAGGSCAP